MHGVTVSWIGQSSCLPKCSASRESKSRIRRTKEERKTMAMSFIKKYQSSNNGKFPSLNLTHKEVGGSFYTIREIVRDIIQENKVLGPGNPSSKLLNLEYYSEEEADTGSFLVVNGDISISAIGDGIDHAHFEVDSSLEQQEVSSEENFVINKPGAQVMFKTDLNENFSWQLKNGETSLKTLNEDSAYRIVVHEKLINTGTTESDFHSLTAKKDDAWGSGEQINAEVQANRPEDIGIEDAKQYLSLYPTVSGTFLTESELTNEDTNNKISVTTRFEESTNISNCGADNHQVLTLNDDMLHHDSSSETVVPTVSNTSQISRSAHKVHLLSEPFVKGTVIYSSELETSGSDREIASNSSSAAKGNVPFIPFHKEPFTSSAQSREIASCREQGIDAADEKSVDSFVLQTTRSPAPGATKNDIPLVDKSSSFVDAVKQSENSSSKLVETAIQEADQSDIKFEKQSDAFSTVNGGGFMSSSKEEAIKESEMLETNPIWTAIKAFVSSFIKFWSE